MKFRSILVILLVQFACFGAEYVTTNLNDKFHTQITYDKESEFSIKQLEIRSIAVDDYTTTNTFLTWKGPKKLKTLNVRNIALAKDDVKILNTMSNDIWLAKLRPMPSRRDRHNYRKLVYTGLSNAAYSVDDGHFAFDAMKLADFDIDNLKISSFNIEKPELPALSLLVFDVQNRKNTISKYSNSLNLLNTVVLNSGAIQLASLGIDSISIDDMSEVKIEDPEHVNVADSYSTDVLVVDGSRFNVYWSAETYEELERLSKAYQYGYSYGGETSPRMKDFYRLASQNGNDSLYYKWLNILWNNKTLDIQKIKPSGPFKIVGEAWIYSNRWDSAVKQQFIKNLQWTKTKGYDSVLVRFDCTENLTNVLEMVQMIKDNGMKVFSVYVGQDNTCPRWNPYIDPDILAPFFKAVIAQSYGYILGWRETSTHVRLLPNEFFNYLCALAREANPNVLIYGEIYYGITSSSYGRRSLYYNIPKNATGVVVQNMGFVGYNYGYIVQKLFKNVIPDWKTYDKVFQVIGLGPYYRTKAGHNGDYVEGLTLEDEYKSKAYIEKAFKTYGGKTITMIHDGVDDNYTFYIASPDDAKHWNNTTDNMLYDPTLAE